jgi:rubrerythrin
MLVLSQAIRMNRIQGKDRGNQTKKRRRRSMSKTEQHLKDAFAGESQANRKYLAFGEKAEKEGYPQIAKLFRAAAAAETVNAHAHLRTLKGIGSTADNLKEAISGETFEFKSMYPAMIADAEAEGEKAALRSFNYANDVEKIHADLYTNALEKMESLEEVDYYVCSVCGYTCESQPPDVCPVCKAKASAFFKVD